VAERASKRCQGADPAQERCNDRDLEEAPLVTIGDVRQRHFHGLVGEISVHEEEREVAQATDDGERAT
jgi:hypothetical protein